MSEREIFDAALDIQDPAERAAYLADVCGSDSALRAHLVGLLQMHGHAGSFLEAPKATAVTIDVPTHERPGTVIGLYKLMEEIGSGGFGLVFVAEQQQPLRRKVALKVIKPGMDTREVIARFEAERQALALMDHPNIARVFDGGTTPSGRPYFVMELVKGVPITEFCDQNHLPIRERLELFMNICRAIQHAHQKGVIHRDLKPSNIMVSLHDATPVVKVIDFGVSKAVGRQLTEKTVYTGFTQMIGTPVYMSPEQAGMSGLDIDTRTDIYALGVLLYELLTGTTPFDKERLRTAAYEELRRIIREEDPPRPSTRFTTLGQAASTISANRKSDPKRLTQLCRDELDWIVMKALEKDRNRRYESASAFAADVQRYLADEPVLACPPSAAYRCRKFAKRYRAALATAVTMAAGVLLAVGSLAAAVVVLAESNAEVSAKQKQTNAALDREKQTSEALKRSLDREQQVMYFHRIALAEREIEARRVGRAEELLAECPPRLHGWEWHYLKRRSRQEPITFRGLGRIDSVAISPNGRMVASTSRGSGEIRIWDRTTAKELLRLSGFVGSAGIVFHPDGKSLISAGSDDTLRIWDVTTGGELRKLHVPEGAGALTVSPDGRLLVTSGRDNTLRVRDVADLRELRTLRGHTRMIYEAAFGPDKLLATGSFDGTVRVWNATTGGTIHTLRGHAGPVLGVAFRRDGKQAASCGVDGTTRVWDVVTGKMVLLIRAENVTTVGVAFSPDGRRLATGSWEKVVRIWDLETDQEAITLRGHADMVMGVSYSSDGDQLVSWSLDGTVRAWDGTPLGSAAAPGERTLRGHTGAVLAISVAAPRDPAAKAILASASRDGTVRLWSPATAETIHTLSSDSGPMGYVSFSRDGRRLVSTDYSGTTRVWDAATGKPIRTFQGTLTRAALSPDARANI